MNSNKDNATANTYYVNQPDSHGFTPLMTATCLRDGVTAMNITKLLVETVGLRDRIYHRGLTSRLAIAMATLQSCGLRSSGILVDTSSICDS